MAHKPIKSFTINSILAKSATDCDKSIAEACEHEDSDCESDLDVTGSDTPPLDCSQKSAEDKEANEGEYLELARIRVIKYWKLSFIQVAKF